VSKYPKQSVGVLIVFMSILWMDISCPTFVEAGSDSFLVHWEGNNNLHRTVQRIKVLGKRAGVAINQATRAAGLEEILPDLDQVLVMTVNPGFGHQLFIHSTLPKIQRVSKMIEQLKPGCELEVDGGIDELTAPLTVAAGANVLVAGSSIFAASVGVCSDCTTWNGRARQDGRQHGDLILVAGSHSDSSPQRFEPLDFRRTGV
jgi:ribulose-phosphate 3-epimerase